MTNPTEVESLRIMRRCLKFNRCSAPICPLDLLADQRTKLQGEPKCTLSRSKRLVIGTGTALPYQGLRKCEWNGMRRWENLGEAEKERRKAILRQFSPFC